MQVSVNSIGDEVDVFTSPTELRSIADELELQGDVQVRSDTVLTGTSVLVTFQAGEA